MSVQPSTGADLWQTWVVSGGKNLVRSSVYIVPVAILAYSGESLTTRQLQVIAAISGPPLIIYATGTLEAVVRTIANFTAARFGEAELKEIRTCNAQIELNTAQRFVRNSISPLSGWFAIVADGHAWYHDNQDNNKRIVFKDYVLFSTADAIGLQPYRLLRATTVHIIQPVLEKTCKTLVDTTEIVVDILGKIGIWNGLSSIAKWSVKLIEERNLQGTLINQNWSYTIAYRTVELASKVVKKVFFSGRLLNALKFVGRNVCDELEYSTQRPQIRT